MVTSSAVAINYATSEFAVTSKRVIAKAGVIRRTTMEVLLDKIEALEVVQGILGRILGFGTVTVHGTGGTRSPFRNLQAPFEFRDRAQEQIASLQDPQ